jgi:hypothetical protein
MYVLGTKKFRGKALETFKRRFNKKRIRNKNYMRTRKGGVNIW